jgi:GNAT superfamily N-acetyltransferase
MSALVFHNLWEDPSEAVADAVLDLWTRERALPARAQPLRRVEQALLAALDPSGRAVAVCTAVKRYSPRLENVLYHYRSFVSADYRQQRLAGDLLVAARDYLEEHRGSEPEAIGILLQLTAPVLQQKTEAVWPKSGMIFVGRSPRGEDLRVYYFRGARIAPRAREPAR